MRAIQARDGEQPEVGPVLADLPDGEQLRCFMPHFGIRLWAGGALRAEAALCFRCNNALTFVDGERGWFEFDGDSRTGGMLRAALERHEPSSTLGSGSDVRRGRHLSGELTLESIGAAIDELARVIDAPASRLPTLGYSQDVERPHVEVHWQRASYIFFERGERQSRWGTGSFDELLYWVFLDVTFYMACAHEVGHRVDGEEPWRSVLTKQVELLRVLDESWFERFRNENRARLGELDR